METETTRGILILDAPVVHKGHIELLRKYADSGNVKTLYLVGKDLLASLEVPVEIRANDPEDIQKMLGGLNLPFSVEILDLDKAGNLPPEGIYTARDTVSRRLREKYFPNTQVIEENVFLRWDESNVTSVRPALIKDETDDPFHVSMLKRARALAENSSDWWRQVAAVIVRDGHVLAEGYSRAYPTENNPYIDGNPRDFVQAGTIPWLGKTVHAELTAIAYAAKHGIRLDGADMYINFFPCPPCACSMGLAGIRRCFTVGGNAYLDTAETLQALGIQTFFVREN